MSFQGLIVVTVGGLQWESVVNGSRCWRLVVVVDSDRRWELAVVVSSVPVAVVSGGSW